MKRSLRCHFRVSLFKNSPKFRIFHLKCHLFENIIHSILYMILKKLKKCKFEESVNIFPIFVTMDSVANLWGLNINISTWIYFENIKILQFCTRISTKNWKNGFFIKGFKLRIWALAAQHGYYTPEVPITVPDWVDKVDYGIRLSYLLFRLHRLAGRYDNPMP